MLIPLSLIAPSPLNPRKTFDETALAELAESIRLHGLIEPLVVRMLRGAPTSENPAGDFAGGFELIAGERRYRACLLAGLTTVPAMSRGVVDDRTALELALVENLQRRDIDPVEEAQGYRQLQELGYTQKQIGERVNRSQPAIANAIRLLELPEGVQARIQSGELSVSHGVALCRWKAFPAVASIVAAGVSQFGVTTREIERGINALGYQVTRALEAGSEDSPAGAIRQVFHATPFREVCQKCPYGAYDGGWCLKPEHFDALMAEAKAVEQARLAATAAELKAGTKAGQRGRALGSVELVKLSALEYDSYQQIPSAPPAGCTEQCPCRSAAQSHGGRVVEICTDPKRYRALQGAETRVRNKQLKVDRALLTDRLTEAILHQATNPHLLRRAAVLLYAEWIGYSGDQAHQIPALAAEIGIKLPDLSVPERESGAEYNKRRPRLMTLLAECDASGEDLLRLFVYRELKTKLRDSEPGGEGWDRAEWFVRDLPAGLSSDPATAPEEATS